MIVSIKLFFIELLSGKIAALFNDAITFSTVGNDAAALYVSIAFFSSLVADDSLSINISSNSSREVDKACAGSTCFVTFRFRLSFSICDSSLAIQNFLIFY